MQDVLFITVAFGLTVALIVFAWRVQTFSRKRKPEPHIEPLHSPGLTPISGGGGGGGGSLVSHAHGAFQVTSAGWGGSITIGPGTTISGMSKGVVGSGGTFTTKAGGWIVQTYSDEVHAVLPERDDDEPIGAFKLANLCWRPGGLVLTSLNSGSHHDRLAEAHCDYRGCTHIPNLDCTCGFYALKDRDTARGYGDLGFNVLLEVELSGRVLVCAYGYRAQWQRILRVEVPGGCYYCGAPAVHVVISEQTGYSDADVRGVTMRCAEHVARAEIPLRPTVVGIPLTFTDDGIYGAHSYTVGS